MEGNMIIKSYIDTVSDNLCNNALKSGISNPYYFRQEKDTKHITYIMMLWLLYYVKKSIANSKTITRPQSDWKFIAYFGYEKGNFLTI